MEDDIALYGEYIAPDATAAEVLNRIFQYWCPQCWLAIDVFTCSQQHYFGHSLRALSVYTLRSASFSNKVLSFIRALQDEEEGEEGATDEASVEGAEGGEGSKEHEDADDESPPSRSKKDGDLL